MLLINEQKLYHTCIMGQNDLNDPTCFRMPVIVTSSTCMSVIAVEVHVHVDVHCDNYRHILTYIVHVHCTNRRQFFFQMPSGNQKR